MLSHRLSLLNSKKIFLGSSSPRRKEILSNLGLKFEVRASSFLENLDKKVFSPVEYVHQTSLHKALDLNEKLHQEQPDLIICADSIVVLNDIILEKPLSKEHAFEMLKSLSNAEHVVYTSVSLVFSKKKDPSTSKIPWIYSFTEGTRVTFCELPAQVIQDYIDSGTPMDKAGGYGIQDVTGGSFVKSISGCYYNVVGFPLNAFCLHLLNLIDQGVFT